MKTTEKAVAHTVLPWEVKDYRDVSEGRHDDVFVAAPATPDHPYYNGTRSIEILSQENYPRKRADAAFIVRAANAHYQLLEALKRIVEIKQHVDAISPTIGHPLGHYYPDDSNAKAHAISVARGYFEAAEQAISRAEEGL